MKKILLLINTLLLLNVIKAQDDFDFIDSQTSVNWGDNAYSNFFSGSCQAKKKSVKISTIQSYNQCDYTDNYGNSCKKCGSDKKSQCKICDMGCALTCCAMILKTEGFSQNPSTWNSYLINNNGYNTCGVKYTPLASYTSNKISSNSILMYGGSSDDSKAASVLKRLIDNGGYALVKVKSTNDIECGHVILIYDYNSPGTALNNFIVSDPGTSSEDGTRKSLGDYQICKSIDRTNGPFPFILINANPNAPKASSTVTVNSTTNYDINVTLIPVKVGDHMSFLYQFDKKKSANNYCNLLWVLKDSYGNPLETSKSETYEPASSYLQTPGTYYVSLAIQTDEGFDAEVKTITVEDNTPPPPPPPPPSDFDFTYYPANPTTADYVSFTIQNKPFGLVTWNVGEGTGDDTNNTGSTKNHMFAYPGTYTVTCNVGDYTVQYPVTVEMYTGDDKIRKLHFKYLNNNWYATAKNTEFKIQDDSWPASNVKYIFVCWETNVNYCKHFFEDMEGWGSYQPEPCIINFKIWEPGKVLTHVYPNEGHFSIRYSPIPSFSDDRILYDYEYWGGANIIDCNKTRTSGDFISALNYDWGWGRVYFSGNFVFSSPLDWYFFRNNKTVISACKSIELNPGTFIEPAKGKYACFEVGQIEGSQSSSKKSEVIPDDGISFKESDINEPKPAKEIEVIVFPNPSDGNYTILSNLKEPFNVMVYNTTGSSVKALRNCVNGTTVNITDQPAGIYFMQVESKSKLINFKVIKY